MGFIRVRRARLAGLATVGTLAAAAALLINPTVASATASRPAVSFPGSVPAWATASADRGTANAKDIVEGEIFLPLPDIAAAEKLALAVSTPGSPSYHDYLSPAAWIAEYSPSQASYTAVENYVTGLGLTVVGTPTDREYIVFRGPASKVGPAFGTSLHSYAYAGKLLLAPASAPKLPAGIASLVSGVSIDQGSSLTHPDNVSASQIVAAAEKASGVKAAAVKPATAKKTPPPPPVCSTYWDQLELKLPTAGGVSYYPAAPCGYSTTQIGGAYGETPTLTSGTDGTGQTVAIVDAYSDPTIVADSDRIEAQTGTQPLAASQFTDITPPKSSWDDEALCQEPAGWQAEESIDVQSVHGMAPGAKILYSGGIDCEGGLDLAVSTILDQGLANIISNSYGDLGENLSQNMLVGEQSKELQAAGEGIGLYFSSGDYGDDAAQLGYTTPNFEASSPWVTAVGGTSLAVSAANTYEFETGWGSNLDPVVLGHAAGKPKYQYPLPGFFYAGAGGGASTQYAEPSYQEGVVPTALATNALGGTGRAVPDISSLADPFTGLLIGISPIKNNNNLKTGPFEADTYGGTSLASPLLAGQMALAQAVTGTDIGFANPAIYALDASSPTSFHDILAAGPTAAVGFVTGSGSLYRVSLGTDSSLTSQAGYDQVTGVGSSNLPGLVKLAELK